MAKKKMLPEDFEARLARGNLGRLKSVFDDCDLDARGGYAKRTALGFQECPDALSRWLVTEGANIEAKNGDGETPLIDRAGGWRGTLQILIDLGADLEASSRSGTALHAACERHMAKNVAILTKAGAAVQRKNPRGYTPLELALQTCENADIEDTAFIVQTLLRAGAKKTARMKIMVREIGQRFEFHRASFNRAHMAATDRALTGLFKKFGVPPVPRRAMHDGKSLIKVKAKRWAQQHQELWELLVSSSGAADTVQGEVIRIAGRIQRELEDNGGINWDSDYKKMADAFARYVGNPEAKALAAEVKRKRGDTARMVELSVAWVLKHPKPIKLVRPNYKR